MGIGIFFNVPAHGHINPTLPIVNELVKRGETIIYYSTEAFREKIENAGAKYKPYSFSLPQGPTAGGNFVKLAGMLLKATEEVMSEEMEYIRKLQPDYIIHDSMSPWGKYIAKHLGIKAVNTTSTFVFTGKTTGKADGFRKKIFKMALEEGMGQIFDIVSIKRRLKVKYGAESKIMDLFRNEEDLNIVFTSWQFQPDGAKLGDKFAFIGPSICDRKDAPDFSFRNIGDRKFVYISLGTIANERLKFYRECIKAFSESGFNVLISIGSKVNKKELGVVPSNIYIEDYVPQIEVLKRASLFISHGGMNSVNEALYFGVPLLILPQQSEQVMVAKRVEELGAGICITKDDIDSEYLLEKSVYIMESRSFYESAGKIGEDFRESGGYKAGADAILNYVMESEV
ncbi:MAG: macrolide family glycosyltransferase [Desulfosporosinus sp.]